MSNPLLTPAPHLQRRQANDVLLLARVVEQFLPIGEELTPIAILRILETCILSNYTASSRRQMVFNLQRHFETHEQLMGYVPQLLALRRVFKPTPSRITAAAQQLQQRCDCVNIFLDHFSSSFSVEGQNLAHALWATTVLNLPVHDWANLQYDQETNKVFIWSFARNADDSDVRRTVELLNWNQFALGALRDGLVLRHKHAELLTANHPNLSMHLQSKLLQKDINRLLLEASALQSGRTSRVSLNPLTKLNLANGDGTSSISCRVEYYKCVTGAPNDLPHIWFFNFALAAESKPFKPAFNRLLSPARQKYIVPEVWHEQRVVPLIAPKGADSDSLGLRAPTRY